MSTEGEMKFAAALLTSPVSAPPAQMRSTIASICSGSRTSQMWYSTMPPCRAVACSSATVCCSTFSRRPQMYTEAPCAANWRANSFPRPVPPPVMRMRLPASTSARKADGFMARASNGVNAGHTVGRFLTRLVIGKHLSADDVLHHLDGAAGDLDDAGIGVGAGDRILPHVAPAAEQLQTFVDYPAVHVGQPHLGHRRVHGVELALHEDFDALVDELASHRSLGPQFGHLELGVLEVSDGLAEGLALGGVGHRVVDHRLGHGGRTDGLRQPLLGQLGHHQLEALALVAQHVRGGHAQLVKEQFRCVLRLHAQLIKILAASEAWQAGV